MGQAWTEGPSRPAAGEASPSVSKAWEMVSSQASFRKSQPKSHWQGQAGHPSCPMGILHPCIRGPMGARTGQPALVFPPLMELSEHLHKHYVHWQHFGGGAHKTPQPNASPRLPVPRPGQGGDRSQAANPQLGLVPVTSAQPLPSHCHPPISTTSPAR